jgi:hypothetical protein
MIVIFHDVNAIILIIICAVMITIAWEDATRLEEHNDVWLCHVIS